MFVVQLTIYHLLKLFQNDPAVISGKKNVVSEQYDEIVFTDPTSTMYRVLTSPKSMVPAVRHEPGIDCKGSSHTRLFYHVVLWCRVFVGGECLLVRVPGWSQKCILSSSSNHYTHTHTHTHTLRTHTIHLRTYLHSCTYLHPHPGFNLGGRGAFATPLRILVA